MSSPPKPQRMITPREYSIQVEREEASTARWLLYGILGILISFSLWAYFAEMENVTRATGKVIPSSKVKIVQHFEGGIVYEILAYEGELVKEGQSIITIDNTKAESEMNSVESKLKYDRGKVARLRALTALNGDDKKTKPNFPEGLDEEVIFQETVAYNSSFAEYQANIQEFENKLDQRKQKKTSIYQELDLRRQQLQLLSGTIEAYNNLKGARAVSRLELDEKQNKLIETKLTISALNSEIPLLDSETKEIIAQRNKYIEAFRYDAVQKMSETNSEIEASESILRDRKGAFQRTEVVSPIAGVINQLYVSSLGEVIKPGGEVAEIVPIEDELIVEGLVLPMDIGFVHIGQTAKIKISAFDSARYGSLVGKVTNISSDTIVNKEMKDQSFYRVRISTDEVLQDRSGNELPISSGMTVTVDIITGKKAVWEYILLPIKRGMQGAIRQQ